MMTSTFVSGSTAHIGHSLQLKQLVVKETILSYRVSLTMRFSLSSQIFVLLQESCYVVSAFGSMLQQLFAMTGTGLATLNSHVSLCLFVYSRCGTGGIDQEILNVLLYYGIIYLNVISENALTQVGSFRHFIAVL